MKAATVKARLNEGSLLELTRTQRALGREGLPEAFRGRWRERYGVATDVLRRWRAPGVIHDMAVVLQTATSYVGTVAPPARPDYCQYTDARMLDWYLSSSTDLEGLEQRCLDAVHALCEDLRRFETASLDRPAGLDVDADVDRIRRRIALLGALLRETEAKGGRPAPEAEACDTVEAYVRSSSRIPALLHLTAMPLTRSHDEYAFLRILQGSEFCFFGIRIAAAAAIEAVKTRQPEQATADLEDAKTFADVLCGLLRVLRTMPVEHFAAFRYNTGGASAIQSINFQLLDAVLHGVNPAKMPHLARFEHLRGLARHADSRFVSLRAAVRQASQPGAAWDAFREACRRLDRTLLTWRGLHLSFAKTYIPNNGPGTGGTSGAAYLREHLLRGIFDDDTPNRSPIDEACSAGGAPRLRPSVAIAP